MSEDVPERYASPFETSPSVDKLLPALIAAQAEFKPAAKGAENVHFQRRYADLSDVWESCCGPLQEHKFAVLYPLRPNGDGVDVSVVLWHESGQWIRSWLTLKADLKRPQEIGSGITYFRRYLLASLLAVSIQDDDGEAAMRRQQGQGNGRADARRDRPRNATRPAEGKIPPRDDGPPASLDPASATKAARRFESALNGFCQRMNAAWVDRHTSEDGEIPGWVKDLANTYQVVNHMLKEAGIEIPKGGNFNERMKAASKLWVADEAGTVAGWKRYVKDLAMAAEQEHAGDDGEGELAQAAAEAREPGSDDDR